MKLLGIETAFKCCSVAIGEKDAGKIEIIRELNEPAENKQIEVIFRLFEEIFSDDIKIKDIECIVVDKGPGSFTGVRIGVAIARGLSQILNLGVIGISSLEALTEKAKNLAVKGDYIVPLVDALRGEVYTCLYKKTDSALELIRDFSLIDFQEWLDFLKNFSPKIIFTGSNTELFEDSIKKKIKNPIISYAILNAGDFLKSTQYNFDQRVSNYNQLFPLYLKGFTPAKRQGEKQ